MKEKIHLSQTVKNILIIIVIALVFFSIGKFWPSNEVPTQMSSELLSNQIQSISELATVEYNYTNMGKFENHNTFYGWEVPFTTKSFIISYDGKVKAGIDMTQVEVKLNNKKIDITMPTAKILSHEIDEKSIEVFDETQNIFNQISIKDYHQFTIDQKEKIEKNVTEKGLITEAQEKAKTAISTFIKTSYQLDDEYKIEFTVK